MKITLDTVESLPAHLRALAKRVLAENPGALVTAIGDHMIQAQHNPVAPAEPEKKVDDGDDGENSEGGE